MITCKEQHRLGDRVNVGVVDGVRSILTGTDNDGNPITADIDNVVYDRYVDAAEWDEDPKAVTASIADYLAKLPVPEQPKPSAKAAPVVMTDHEVTEKLAEIATKSAVAFADAAIADLDSK